MKFNLVALTVLSALLAGKSMATTPPSPIRHEIKLTDGTSSEAILRGTADFHWFEDKQGNEAACLGEHGIIARSELLGSVVVVIPTNEEYVIAKQSVELL